MVNVEIRLIISFAVEDGEALYIQRKQDLELTVAHIMSFLLKTKKESEVVQLCLTLLTPWTVAYQTPTSMGFSR